MHTHTQTLKHTELHTGQTKNKHTAQCFLVLYVRLQFLDDSKIVMYENWMYTIK